MSIQLIFRNSFTAVELIDTGSNFCVNRSSVFQKPAILFFLSLHQMEQNFLDATGTGRPEQLLDSGLKGRVMDFDVHDFILQNRVKSFLIVAEGQSGRVRVRKNRPYEMEALRKAVELRPDLILLDISLPSLNGIEVARQMRSLVPESKIIFLTRESSSDVVQEALGLGARGYVIKNMVLADLFAAVETVLLGITFVSNP
jgi:CheY-like chemotaxis protein